VKPNNANRPAFDASAVLALMQGEPGTDKLKALQPNAVVNAVNAAEVLPKLVSRGMPAAEAQAASDALTLRRHRSNRQWLPAAHRQGSGWTSDHELLQDNQHLRNENRRLQEEISAGTMYPFRESVRSKKGMTATAGRSVPRSSQ
jgi:hypothetical protein